jgi:endonuclease III
MSEVSASDLNIDIERGGEPELFKWFVASFLFGKRIQQEIAAEAYQVIVDEHGYDTPQKLGDCSWQEIVDMLDEGHYVRYDESTAERLLQLCEKLNTQYHGRVTEIYESSESQEEFEKRLADFNGIGPKTVEIFMREAKNVLH